MARHYDDNPGELVIVNPSDRGGAVLYEENPRGRRKKHRSRRGASAKQRAWRKKFGQMYGGGRKQRKRRTNPAYTNPRRRGATMRSVKRRGRPVSRSAWRASGYRHNPRRSYRRNPVAVRASFQGITNLITEATQGAVGATLVDMAMGQLVTRGLLPATMLTPTLYPVVKGGVAIGVGLLGNMLPVPAMFKRIINEGVKGSLIVTLRDTIQPFVRDTFPLGARRFNHTPGTVGRRAFTYSSPPELGWRASGQVMAGVGNYTPMATREREAYYPAYSVGEYMR